MTIFQQSFEQEFEALYFEKIAAFPGLSAITGAVNAFGQQAGTAARHVGDLIPAARNVLNEYQAARAVSPADIFSQGLRDQTPILPDPFAAMQRLKAQRDLALHSSLQVPGVSRVVNGLVNSSPSTWNEGFVPGMTSVLGNAAIEAVGNTLAKQTGSGLLGLAPRAAYMYS